MRLKYAVWFLRLVFGAWMIPAGLMHFIPLFPQPLGTQPLSREVMLALLDSGLMDVIKTVELLAGVGVFAGLYAPLALLVCMPVSFCVYWWDAHLQRSGAAVYGVATLLANALLCLAYLPTYRAMLSPRAEPLRPGSARYTTASAPHGATYESLFVLPGGRTTRADFIPAWITWLAAATFYGVLVRERPGMWCMVAMMVFPAIPLHARRLRDMGRSAWLLAIPGVPAVAALAIWLGFTTIGAAGDAAVLSISILLYAAFAAWCLRENS